MGLGLRVESVWILGLRWGSPKVAPFLSSFSACFHDNAEYEQRGFCLNRAAEESWQGPNFAVWMFVL